MFTIDWKTTDVHYDDNDDEQQQHHQQPLELTTYRFRQMHDAHALPNMVRGALLRQIETREIEWTAAAADHNLIALTELQVARAKSIGGNEEHEPIRKALRELDDDLSSLIANFDSNNK